MLYNDSGVLLRNGRVYLGNKIYFAEQFSDDIVTGLNNDVRDLNSDNDILFMHILHLHALFRSV